MRLSRWLRSDAIVVVSTAMSVAVTWSVSPDTVSVAVPVTPVEVRPTASLSASSWASRSRTR